MRTKTWFMAAVLPASLLALSSIASAATVDCQNFTITCNTFTKGTAKFKPALNAAAAVGTCPTSIPANLENISIKGTVSDCTVGGQATTCTGGTNNGGACTNNGQCPLGKCGVQVISGS